jgi:hypothetical protein
VTPTQAHSLLDAARSGVNVSSYAITQALRATGDLDPPRLFDRPPMASQVPPADPLDAWTLPALRGLDDTSEGV